jgi:hypothetical protein
MWSVFSLEMMTTRYDGSTRQGEHLRTLFEKGSVESTHKVPTSHYPTRNTDSRLAKRLAVARRSRRSVFSELFVQSQHRLELDSTVVCWWL